MVSDRNRSPRAKIVELKDPLAQRAKSECSYLEFLESDGMSTGIYFLAKGEHDGQSPHSRDEVYYVLDGKAKFRAHGEDRPVSTGSVILVPKHVEHRFVDIEEDLTTLVIFAADPEDSDR